MFNKKKKHQKYEISEYLVKFNTRKIEFLKEFLNKENNKEIKK